MGWLQDARAVWRTLVIIATPIVLLPLVLPGSSQESRCSYVLGVMAVYWITEALPLAVTALVPVLLLPLLGIMTAKQTCQIYFKDVIFLLLGGLIVAIAIEESNLHKRFALRLLLLLGVQPRKLLLGFMLSTGFLSMWITNTATTAMMTPIARALLSRLFKAQQRHRHKTRRAPDSEQQFAWPIGNNEDVELAAVEKGIGEREILIDTNENNGIDKPRAGELDQELKGSKEKSEKQVTSHTTSHSKALETRQTATDEDIDDDDDDDDDDDEIDLNVEGLDERSANLAKGLCLCVCYSANIGGVGTLTGTGPNIVYKSYVESLSGGEDQVSFLSWMAFGFPVGVCHLALTFVWLQLFYFGFKSTLLCRRQTSVEEDRKLEGYLRRQHRRLGNMGFAEKVVLGHFLVLVALWLTRSPGVFPGWSEFFPKGYLSDAVPAVLVAISLFVFPKKRPAVFCCRGDQDSGTPVSSPTILQWSSMSKKFPWGVLLLLGGGFALAEATKVSGLSNLIAQQLMVVGDLSPWVACIIVVIVTSIATEITSNTVIATLLLPILAQVAVSMDLHPIYFMLPSAIASSFAFMLPVATPPNAIVFAHGDIKVMDMIKTGTILNIIGIAVVTTAINTFGYAYFDLGHVPDWAFRLVQATPTSVQNITSVLLNNSVTVSTEVQGILGNVTAV